MVPRRLLMLGVALAAAFALLVLPTSAHACPMCKDAVESDSQLAAGYNWSVIGLVSLPFILVTVIMAHAVRVLNPTAYTALKQRAWEFLWPKGWLYLFSGFAAIALLFYMTTPSDPATRLRLPSSTLEAQPTLNLDTPIPQLKGRVVVVTFFASWCPPCVEQMADLARLQQEFAEESVIIVTVSAFEDEVTPPGVPHLHADGTLEFHEGAPDLPGFIAANDITLPVVASTPALSASFGGITRIPTTFVFDPEGRLVARHINEPRGDFVRPKLEDLRQDVRGALACGSLSPRLIGQVCIFLRDKDQRLGLEAGPW